MEHRHFIYENLALGVRLEEGCTVFRLWVFSGTEVQLNIYKGWRDYRRRSFQMKKVGLHIWELALEENLKGFYYTYTINHYGSLHEFVDPYAVASSPNSKRGFIIDLADTNPEGWADTSSPEVALMDTVIYETHVRDLTVKWHARDHLQGTFNGVTLPLLKKIKDLGVTHIQWMPVFDFARVDELGQGYNWGYDPLLFNVVEGSYASDVDDPKTRIRELKEMIMRCHEVGLKVIMDVVYNHTFHSKDSNLNRVGPNYFYRMLGINKFANGSGCGNELATEKPMVRKYIIDSLLYWQKEYKIDGFRFDLMGLYDVETVRAIEKALKSVDESVILYGEPWTAGGSALAYEKQFRKGILMKGQVGYFNDDFRNVVKGDNDSSKRGYIGGIIDTKVLLNSLVGSFWDESAHIGHAKFPWESINYLTSHDNLNLFDKISKSFPGADYETKKKICGLCFSILLTSIGIPFIQGGAAMMATKQGHHNTYNMGDDINAYDWSLADLNEDLRRYVMMLTDFRKNTFIYQLDDFKTIRQCCKTAIGDNGVVTMTIHDEENKEEILIFHNGSEKSYEKIIDDVEHEIICDGTCFGTVFKKRMGTVHLPAYQTVILKKKIMGMS
jgi:pullulanase